MPVETWRLRGARGRGVRWEVGGVKKVLAEARVAMEGMGLPRRLVLAFRVIVGMPYGVLMTES